jgi:flagellin-like hook-associated protein FlgL
LSQRPSYAGVSNAPRGIDGQKETLTINIGTLTSLNAYSSVNRYAGTSAWGVGGVSSMGISSQTAYERNDLAGTAMRSQIVAEQASVSQGIRNITHTVTVVQNAADSLQAIGDALEEMETLVDDASRGALWETEEAAAQTRIDDLLVEINRLANMTTDRSANLLAAGAGSITITLGKGSGSESQTIDIPTFDMTTQGLVLGDSLELDGENTASLLSTAIATVDNAMEELTAVLPRMSAALRATTLSSEFLSNAAAPIIDLADADALAAGLRMQLIESAGIGLASHTNALSQKALELLGIPSTTPRSETLLPWHKTSII